MITDHLLGEGLIPFVAWTVLCWMLGVGWAAYRAVGWVERIRTWAANECSAVDALPPAEHVGDSERKVA